jgi:hypothetical protein
MDDILEKYHSSNKPSNDVSTPDKVEIKDDLLSKYHSSGKVEPDTSVPEAFDLKKEAAKNRSGLMRGARDVLDTGVEGLASITQSIIDKIAPEKIAKENRERNQEKIFGPNKAEREKFDQENPASTGLVPNRGEIQRTIGQLAATAPLLPAKAIGAITGAFKAAPTILASGEKVAAPLLNRLGASVATGGFAGGVYGGATSSANDEGILPNVGKGVITGAVGGPIGLGVGAALSKVIPAAKQAWLNFGPIQKLAQTANAPASAIKNVIERLEDAGFTPQTAKQALDRMGPKATLADLDPALTTEASGLASLGGKPTTILKTRFEARNAEKNEEAKKVIDTVLGPKPDIEAEKDAIYRGAQAATRNDYEAAKASGQALNSGPIVEEINKQLKTAVGEKASVLKAINSYFFTNEKNAVGDVVQKLKTDIPSLHEVRIELDSILDKAGTPANSAGRNALRAVENVRNALDKELKTNPQMAAADAKFAQEMKVKNALEYGQDALKKGNKEEFIKAYDAATPAEKAAIRKGMHGSIVDLMESAQKGELSGAQRLFGDKSVNKAKLRKAFGPGGDIILDSLEKEAAQRFTERAVTSGSQTAERQAVQRRYGDAPKSHGNEFVQGLTIDALGGHGLGSIVMNAKKYVGNRLVNISKNKLHALAEGTADILSRAGVEAKDTLSSMDKVNRIQNKLAKSKKDINLPVIFSPAFGQAGYSEYKKANQ